jgi:glycosyltransferase involved in cell wall biosynthesis
MREEWQNLAGSLGVAGRVSFLGKVPYLKMPGLYRSADALIFTSLRDSFGSQVLEAMASGLPIIGLDHHGVHEFVPNEAGVKVPVANPEETVSALANAIRRLASSVDEAARMVRSAWEFAATQRWERRAEVMNDFYADIVQSR